MTTSIGKRIEQARLLAGLEQEELAEKVGLTQQAISRIETGKTKTPRNLNSFAKALNVSINFLLTGENDFIDSYRTDTEKGIETRTLLGLISHLTSSQRKEAISIIQNFKNKNDELFMELGELYAKKMVYNNNNERHA